MSGYIGTTPVPEGSISRQSFVCQNGQVSFPTTGYLAGGQFVLIHLNGVLLKLSDDYTASNGSDIVLTSGAAAGDILEFTSFNSFSVSDTVSASSGGTFNGDVGFGVASPVGKVSVQQANSNTPEFIIEAVTEPNDFSITGYSDSNGAYWMLGANNYINSSGNNATWESGEYSSSVILDARNGNGIQFYTGTGTGSERMRINGDGVITQPAQPAFQVTKSGNQSNIAVGSATVTFDTEIFDQGSNFSSNAFTAPVTGKYQLSLMLYLDNLDSAANYYQAWIATSNRGYYSIFDPDYGQDNGYMFINASILADMDANDTAYVGIEMGANGNAQTDINATTKFSGYLVA
jgi:hypothetical protein